jgi:hypothetical protein
MKIYIVLHHEIMGTPEDCRADEMVFYTCDSLEKALRLIKESRVDRWSWWEIQSQNSTVSTGRSTWASTGHEQVLLPNHLMTSALRYSKRLGPNRDPQPF